MSAQGVLAAEGGVRRAADIVAALAVSDFRLKYYDSVRGYLWSMLSPLLMLATYYLIFRNVVGVALPGYLSYLVVGIVYWTFFQDCTYSGLGALVARAPVLKAVGVPVGLVIAGGAASTLITLAINTVVLAGALAAAGVLGRSAPLAVLPIGCLVLFAAGVSLFVAVAHVRFRDTGLVWGIVLQAWFWLTPIVYPAGDGALAGVLHLNPLARCLHLIRWFLLRDDRPDAGFVALTVLSCAATFAAGAHVLKRQSALIPERL